MNVRTTSVKETKFYSQKQKKKSLGKWETKKKKKEKKLIYCCLESPGGVVD